MRHFQALCLLASIFILTAASAKEVIVGQAPPANREEWVPPHQSGQIWNPGHWEWNGKSFWWKRGYWIVDRRGANWVPDHWEASGDQWRFLAGHWDH